VKTYNPLYWSVPLSVGFMVLGGAIVHVSNTARQALPQLAQTTQAVSNASQTARDVAKNAPQTAGNAGRQFGQEAVVGAVQTAVDPQHLVTDRLPTAAQAAVDPMGAAVRAIGDIKF
jgi:hypothetical protein